MKTNCWDEMVFYVTEYFTPDTWVSLYFNEESQCIAYLELDSFTAFLDIEGELELENVEESKIYHISEINDSIRLKNIVRQLARGNQVEFLKDWRLTKKPYLSISFDMDDSNVKTVTRYDFEQGRGAVWCQSLLLQAMRDGIAEHVSNGTLILNEKQEHWFEQLKRVEVYSVQTTMFHMNHVEKYMEKMKEREDLLLQLFHLNGEVTKHFTTFLWDTDNQKASTCLRKILAC